MDEIVRRAVRSALFLVAACLVVRFMVPDGKTIAAGIILGVMASLMNALLLRRRINLIDQALQQERPKRVSIGLGARLATVLIVVMIAVKFPEQFNLPSTLISSFYVQLVVFAIAFVQSLRDSSGKG
ncbi:ATP synthase subunit I [Paenibacillus sp. GCM10012307]|uniref:ATP synthase subunit I n=1 Tax=Paenibacillus roseus TaxID=2798579 RepID=A0A934J6Z0_9BACL|nr:ATP synthase subunit I [Paenibacillus roseus]MBJ6361881.1 ATP synthase subunit I [Paenibacillus roseus]